MERRVCQKGIALCLFSSRLGLVFVIEQVVYPKIPIMPSLATKITSTIAPVFLVSAKEPLDILHRGIGLDIVCGAKDIPSTRR